VSLFAGLRHRRWRRAVSLLTAGALEPHEQPAVAGHLDSCAACRDELASLRRTLELIGTDPVHSAEPPLDAAVLAARVRARLDDAGGGRERSGPARLRAAALLSAAAAASALAWLALPRTPPPALDRGARVVEVPDQLLERMERNVVREQTARYLNEAGAVLVTVAARGRDCDEDPERVDVALETSRSRELLRRRALLVELDSEEVATARPVLEDVDQLLLEVAALEACARSRDLELISDHISRRRLLMKIDLMARELQG